MSENELYPPVPDNKPQEVQPGISISPDVQPVANPAESTPQGKKWLKPVLLLAGILVVVGGVAFFGYSQGYSVKGLKVLTPSKIWNEFYTSSTAKVYNTSFTAEYNDPEALADGENSLGIVLKNIKVHLEGTNYSNLTDIEKPEIEGNMKFSVGSGNTSFSSGIDFVALNKNVFYKVGDIPFLSALISSPDKKTDWVKINLEQAQKQSTSESEFVQSMGDPAFQNKIRDIWLENRAIKLSKYVGREKINGVNTLHFKAELDKEASKKAVIETFNAIAALDKTGSITEDDKQIMNLIVDKLVSKIEIKELDAWIGSTDSNLYKLHFASNAPSVVSIIRTATEEAKNYNYEEQSNPIENKKKIEDFLNKLNFDATFSMDATYGDYGKTRTLSEPENAFDLLGQMDKMMGNASDAKRVADVRQLASALELYFNDFNYYPYGLSDLSNTYISTVPTPPTPAGGTCSEEQNAYNYKYVDANNYKLSFCLGSETGGLAAGVHELSPAGIQ